MFLSFDFEISNNEKAKQKGICGKDKEKKKNKEEKYLR